MNNKTLFPIIVIILILVVGGIGFWYWLQKKTGTPIGIPVETPQEKGVVGTAKNISESVPEIQTNPGEKVPEVNPLDRTNPFKYVNPLR